MTDMYFIRFAAFGAGETTSLRIYREDRVSGSSDKDSIENDDEDEDQDGKVTVNDPKMNLTTHKDFFSSNFRFGRCPPLP